LNVIKQNKISTPSFCNKPGFLKSKSGVVVPGQLGSLILLAHQKYWLVAHHQQIFDEQQQQINWSVCPVDN
jgi:hypothetical protein